MENNNWCADQIVFGMGGGLLQKHNRDTYKFAFKCSSITVNGKQRDIFKSPIDGSKKSKAGNVTPKEYGYDSATVYNNRIWRNYYSFEEVREHASDNFITLDIKKNLN